MRIRQGLLEWVGSFMERPKHVFVVHGDDEVCDTFAPTVKEKFGMEADAPFSGTSYDLKEGQLLLLLPRAFRSSGKRSRLKGRRCIRASGGRR